MDIRSFATDANKEVDGVWHDIGDGARIKVARMFNPAHQQVLDRMRKPHAAQLRRGSLPDETARAITVASMAEAVLVDWDGIKDGDTEVPYSKDKALEYLKAYKDFAELVASLAGDAAAYREQVDEDAEGN
jgi:hypothetical protein